jgi:hypothetical protein
MWKRTTALLVVSGLAQVLNASPQETPTRIVNTERPDPPGVATRVQVGVAWIDVMRIDDAEQIFRAYLYASMSWRDPRLALTSGEPRAATRIFGLDEIWHPRPVFVNRRQVERLDTDVLQVDAEGNVLLEQRVIGEFSSQFDVRDFPFDGQSLSVIVASTRYGPEEVVFERDRDREGRLPRFSLVGWDIGAMEGGSQSLAVLGEIRPRAGYRFQLQVQRRPRSQVVKVLIPMGLIVFMAWTVFWLDPSQLGPQLGVATASVISFVAFQIKLQEMLPGVDYLTRMDRYILGATILVFLAFGEAILTGGLAAKGRADLSRRIDRWSRWVYVILFGVLICVTRWA